MVRKSEALPKMDDKHPLHVDEVHMKPTMPRPLTFSLNFNRKGNGTLERPPYAQVNPWDQQLESHATVGLVVMDRQVGRHRRSLIIDQDLEAGTPKHNFITKIWSFFISQKSRQYDSTMVFASCSCASLKTISKELQQRTIYR